jgi:quercetin dioxygenase-like cupin family protein
MKLFNIKDFKKGWIVGNFDPAIIKSKEIEVAVKHYEKGEKNDKHYHKQVVEITVINSGVFLMNNKKISSGDIVVINPEEYSDFICLTKGSITVIKNPSILGDKFIC